MPRALNDGQFPLDVPPLKRNSMRMTERELVFHIGDAKTGSTAIQRAFLECHSELRSAGVLFPLTTWDSANHAILLPRVYGLGGISAGRQARIGNSPEAIARVVQDNISYIRQQIDACDPDIVVLSCESLYKPLNAESGANLRQLCYEFAATAKFICYVRNPVEAFISKAQQGLKSRSGIKWRALGRHRKVLSSYRRLFPDALVVRQYPGAEPANQDVVADFAATAVCKARAPLKNRRHDRPNSAMSAEAMVIAQRIAEKFEAARSTPDKAQILAYTKRLVCQDSELPGFTRPRAQPGFADTIIRMSPDLNWLREEFGIQFSGIDYSVAGKGTHRHWPGRLRVEEICMVDRNRLHELETVFQSSTGFRC